MAVYGKKRLAVVPMTTPPVNKPQTLMQSIPCTTDEWEVQIRKHFSSAWLLALDMGINEEDLHEILQECMP